MVVDGHAAETGSTDERPSVRFAEELESSADAQALDDLAFQAPCRCGRRPTLRRRSGSPTHPAAGGSIAAATCGPGSRRLYRVGRTGGEQHRLRIALARERADRLLRMVPNTLPTDGPTRSLLARVGVPRSPPPKRIPLRATPGAPPQDMAELSPIVAAAEPFHVLRVSVARADEKAARTVENATRTSIEEGGRKDGPA